MAHEQTLLKQLMGLSRRLTVTGYTCMRALLWGVSPVVWFKCSHSCHRKTECMFVCVVCVSKQAGIDGM